MSSPLIYQNTISATTRLTRQQMWTALVNKIKHPEKYVGSRDVKIVGETPEYVDREMSVGPPAHPMVIKERITWDESKGLVIFTERNNEEKTGSVENRLTEEDGVVKVTFVFDWEWTDKANREQTQAMIAKFREMGNKPVEDTVRAAEEDNGLTAKQ